MCGVILYPLVESSLPINVLRSFERQRKGLENELKLSSLDAIIHFLKNEVETEEKIRLSRTDIFHFSSERKNAAPANSRDRKPSATELFISHKSNDNLCMFCFKNHETRSCKKAYFIPLDEKLSVIKRKGLCRICLTKGHLAKFCSSTIKCNLCSERHLKLMCPNFEVNKLDQIPKQSINDIDERITDTLYSHTSATHEVFLQTLVVNIKGKKTRRKARVILDTGSQRSYIKKSTAEELGFEIQREEEFSHALFGGRKSETQRHNCYKIYLYSLDGKYSCSLDALDQDIICKTT
ncbi:transposon Tf2-6 polyprotein [Trichonephila clavata]|uniref:Transposon Tf2-6 polyprotein n=1 Tax=Trichonephila clavata TaxID=2740835 RepID=A0A8X6JQU3_TRICU|nr:transposon Tf2-6 polyprotein [Trichonephila clavata]